MQRPANDSLKLLRDCSICEKLQHILFQTYITLPETLPTRQTVSIAAIGVFDVLRRLPKTCSTFFFSFAIANFTALSCSKNNGFLRRHFPSQNSSKPNKLSLSHTQAHLKAAQCRVFFFVFTESNRLQARKLAKLQKRTEPKFPQNTNLEALASFVRLLPTVWKPHQITGKPRKTGKGRA